MTKLTSDTAPRAMRVSSAHPIRWLFGLFGEVWFGVFLAVLLFVYCSIGSALPKVRQLPALEMTEFEWFHWWPFNVLMVLFCLTLIVVTIRRIPFRPLYAGVWMIHTGILVLCAGSYYYFGTKIEGDTPVFRRQVKIELPELAEPVALVAIPGAEKTVLAGHDVWRFRIQSTNTSWPILSEEHAGEKAYAISVAVTPPHGQPFVRQLLDGYEMYTEDIIPGKGRAIKSLGRKLVDEDLQLTLDYEPQKHFFVMDTWALFARRVGETEWVERPIEGLPRYHDRVASRDQVVSDPHFPVTIRPIDLEVPPASPGDALGDTKVRITGYLRHAQMQRQWRDRGDRLNPVARVSIVSDHATDRSYELVALDPRLSSTEDGIIEFRWLPDPATVESLPTDSRAVLHISVPEKDVSFELPLTRETLAGRDGPFTPIEDTEFSYRVLNVQDNLALPGERGSVSVAMVKIKTPEGELTRMVADKAELTRDMHGGGVDPHTPTARKTEQADPRIVMLYNPRSAPIIVAAHPEGIHFVYNGPAGCEIGRGVKPGELIEIMPGLAIRIDSLWRRAVGEIKPFIVPPPRRERNAGESNAMIRLEVTAGGEVQTKWLRFQHHALPEEQYAQSGRFAYLPERFRLADGSMVEVLFSRQRRELPFPIALDDFELDAHVGGYTGSSLTIRNYVSGLRFLDGGRWTEPRSIAVNAPTEYGGYWYFQSTWDPPPRNNPTGGMNYTGLGVGNRNGVYIQLAGCCLAVTGMIYAFYVKPILKRRRRKQAQVRRARADENGTGRAAAGAAAQAVEV